MGVKLTMRDYVEVMVVFIAIACILGGVSFVANGPNNPPKPVMRFELVDESHHVIYSYETHDNLVLSQSPGLTLRTWKEVEK